MTALLENRGCTVLEQGALDHLVKVHPGPLFYGDIDLCDDGSTWEQAGGPWADRLEDNLVRLGAAHREPDLPTPTAGEGLPGK